MDQNLDVGNLFSEIRNMFRAKHLVDAAMTLPEDHAACLQGFDRVSSSFICVWIPHWHLGVGDSHFERRISSEVLIWKEKDATFLLEGPFQNGWSITRRADHTPVLAAKRFEACRRIDVGHRGDVFSIDDFA